MTRAPAPADSALRLRPLTRADLPFADAVRALAGWNQTRADWERFLATEPDGCFLAEHDGAPAGTATTTVYGPALAWVGMVLVHPDHRRRGVGTALLERCLESLGARGVRCIKLDATPAGGPVYRALGFQDEWTLSRWVGRPLIDPAGDATGVRAWRETDAPQVEVLDAAAFGVSRRKLLSALRAQSTAALVVEDGDGRLEGFGLARPGARASYLGPVVATSAAAGRRLVSALLAQGQGQAMYWDLPDRNEELVRWAQARGFTLERTLTRMVRGPNLAAGHPLQQLALAGPEVG